MCITALTIVHKFRILPFPNSHIKITMSMKKGCSYHPYHLYYRRQRVSVKEIERRLIVKTYHSAPRPMHPLKRTYDLFIPLLVM
ncbi:hypothetical protein ANTRET_LOCUS2364 [Anthophora retusa]